MKKILIFTFLLFLYINNTHAIEQGFIMWCNTKECTTTHTIDITPEKFDITNFYVYARGDLSSCSNEYIDFYIGANTYNLCTWQDSSTWVQLINWDSLNFNNLNTINFTANSTEKVDNQIAGMLNLFEVKVIIDYTIIEEQIDTNTWSIIVNNISEVDPWINKEIFDIYTLEEIFKYEALMMIFILLWTFFNRVIGRSSKRKHFYL